MPFFAPCNCPSGLGTFAVYGAGSVGSQISAARVKVGFASQIVQQGAACVGIGAAQQGGRGPVKSYLGFLGSGANSDFERYDRTNDTTLISTNPFALGTAWSPQQAGPLPQTGACFFFGSIGFAFACGQVDWATETFTNFGTFGGGIFAGQGSGAVYSSDDKVHIAGNLNDFSATKWLFNRPLLAFSTNGVIIQTGGGYAGCQNTTRGYFMGGTSNGTTPYNTVIRFVFDTQLNVFTNNMPGARAQSFGASDGIYGIFFVGSLGQTNNAQATTMYRMTMSTEVTLYSTYLPSPGPNIAGA